jgi:putative acetyltransferase
VADVTIAVEDPRAADVQALLARHLAFAHDNTPPEHIHALGTAGLVDPAVTLFSARHGGRLLGIGALKQLDRTHGELKSMHTAAEARRGGVGRAMVEHLLAVAGRRGYRRVSLETGTMDGFAPARRLYEIMGFVPCGPFGDYRPSADNTFMTIELDG